MRIEYRIYAELKKLNTRVCSYFLCGEQEVFLCFFTSQACKLSLLYLIILKEILVKISKQIKHQKANNPIDK
jgi:hypothetical protein